jgi:hypothetical protein
MCGATPNSDIDCVRRHIRFAAKGDLRTAGPCAEGMTMLDRLMIAQA